MLFDEVMSVLDPELVDDVLVVMRNLGCEGMTMIVVTHEMQFTRKAVDRVIFTDDGTAVETGDPRGLFTSPRSERRCPFLSRYQTSRAMP